MLPILRGTLTSFDVSGIAIIGPYESKRLAEKQRHTLQRAKINGCKIWLWNL